VRKANFLSSYKGDELPKFAGVWSRKTKSLEIKISGKKNKMGGPLSVIGCSAVGAAAIEVPPATLGAVAASFPGWCLGAMNLSLEIDKERKKS